MRLKAERDLGAVGLAALICWAGLAVDPARASEVVVLKSSDLTPFNIVASEISTSRGLDVETVTLAADKRNYDLAVRAVWSAKPDVIVALGAKALDVASREFTDVPVVFGMVAELDAYLERPQGIAGIKLSPSPSQILRAIRAVIPKVSRVAVAFDSQRSGDEIAAFSEAGDRLGIEVRRLPFSPDVDVGHELGSLARSCECLIVYPDPVLLSDQVFGDIVFRAFGLGLPTVAYSSAFARKGALMSVEADYASVGRDLVSMVGDVLGGASAGTMGARTPSRVRVAVNKAVADELGIRFDASSIVLPADAVPTIEVIADQPRAR
jgi:putative ABC transport system substrate-binding protein